MGRVHPTAIFVDVDEFEAIRAAEATLSFAGFSVGPSQRGGSRCILLGDVTIAKWRNLTVKERAECHGQLFGGRAGPVTVMLHADAPSQAVAAFYKVVAASEAARGIHA